MKFFWRTGDTEQGSREDAGQWRRDPLAHPDIARMSLRQQADLPLSKAWIKCCDDVRAT